MADITITSLTVTGEIPVQARSFVNISSCPPEHVLKMLNRCPNVASQLISMPLHPGIIYSKTFSKFIKVGKRKTALLLYDEDTTNLNIIVKNLQVYSNICIVGKIMFKTEKSLTSATGRKGAVRYVCNPQHMSETTTAMGCNNMFKIDPDQIQFVNLFKTDMPTLDGTSGMTVALNMMRVPFMVEKRKVMYSKSWLMLKKKDMEVKYSTDHTQNAMHQMTAERKMEYRIGYTIYLPTEKGYLKIVDANKHKRGSILLEIVNSLVAQITNTVAKILQICKKIGDWVYSAVMQISKRTNP